MWLTYSNLLLCCLGKTPTKRDLEGKLLHVASGDLNVGAHTFLTSVLPTESFP